jgi:hypothetical protein
MDAMYFFDLVSRDLRLDTSGDLAWNGERRLREISFNNRFSLT